MKTLTTLFNQQRTYILKNLLQDSGIHAFLINENFSIIEGGLGFAGIKIDVNDDDYDKALLILQEFKKNESK